jgi:CubicO group peptidase (beta-lactamase class C family)
VSDLGTHINAVLASHIADSIDEIPATRACSASQWAVSTPSGTYHAALGHSRFTPDIAMTPTTPVDIASVTKVFTATACMIAVDEGRVTLDTPVSTFFPTFEGPTLRHLLNHTSGLPAWRQFYLELNARDTAAMARNREFILREILATERYVWGHTYAYSDLGYILLGRVVESIFGQPLDEVIRTRITEPLGMTHTRFVNLLSGDTPLSDAAATERCEMREPSGDPVIGVVHDENCWIQGGVCGHAGLFSTASDLLTFGQHLLAVDSGHEGIVSRTTLQSFWAADQCHKDGHHVLGWDTPSGERTSVGRGFSRAGTVGHLGFTGCSLWISRLQKVVAILLTNRVYPTRQNPRILDLRIAFHEAVIPPSLPPSLT